MSNIAYDGCTLFENLNTISKHDKVLVFTDGKKVKENDFLSLNENDVIVNSSKNANVRFLNFMAYFNKAALIDFLENQKPKIAPSHAKKSLGTLVNGTVYLDGKPVPNVSIISSFGNDRQVVTDDYGKFSFQTNLGDTLKVLGTKLVKSALVVKDFDTELQFFLDSNTVSLDEVVVSESKLDEKVKVNTAYGLQNNESIGYAVSTVGDADINDSESKLHEALEGKVSGLQINKASGWDNRSTLGKTLIRGINSINMNNYALVVIDGVPVESTFRAGASGSFVTQFETLGSGASQKVANFDYINPDNIASVTVLKGLAATNRFGTMGGNGVILITTKTAAYKDGVKKNIDQALLTNNIFEGKLVSKKGQLNTPYLKDLRKAKNVKEVYDVYLGQRTNYLENNQYFIDVSDYFRTVSPPLADRVLSNILEKKTTYNSLRKLFLKYRFLEDWSMALVVAKKMFFDYPKKIQTYYDFAIAQKDAGYIQKSADLLNGIVTGAIDPTLDFSPLNKIAGATLRNLVNRNNSKLDLSKIDGSYKNNLTYNVRLIFDWERPQDEFVLKFVNPQKRFFDWEHSALADRNRITSELKNGFSVEQFELIGDISIGDWQVNVTNLSSEANNHPFLIKCTVQHNFGKSNQREEKHIIRLDDDDTKEQLFFKLKAE
ncbi:TonB-dependent receptor plug domain-containing protein [Croceitalea sp. MTPC5]|uniref:TonB-dependent receptor plug domain-containing protein n=1 Tax=Croceitalea sp. MTPC5 TaxID=3056565 RepID=UPI0030D0141D